MTEIDDKIVEALLGYSPETETSAERLVELAEISKKRQLTSDEKAEGNKLFAPLPEKVKAQIPRPVDISPTPKSSTKNQSLGYEGGYSQRPKLFTKRAWVLTKSAMLVYNVILDLENYNQAMRRETKIAYSLLAKYAHMNKKTAKDAVNELKALGWLRVTVGGYRVWNKYETLVPSDEEYAPLLERWLAKNPIS